MTVQEKIRQAEMRLNNLRRKMIENNEEWDCFWAQATSCIGCPHVLKCVNEWWVEKYEKITERQT